MGRKISKTLADAVLTDIYNRTGTAVEIARRHGVSPAYVRQRFDTPRPAQVKSKAVDWEQENKKLRDYIANMTIKSILD